MILRETELRGYIQSKRLLVEPFSEKILQYNGLDLRLGNQIARLRPCCDIFDTHDQKIFDRYYTRESDSSFIIRPHEHFLACTYEKLGLPNNLVGFVNLRSTCTRLGLFSPCGFVEAGFSGQLTVEIIGGSFPLKVYVGDRMFHIVFMVLTSETESIYKGKYQNQAGVTLPILDSNHMFECEVK